MQKDEDGRIFKLEYFSTSYNPDIFKLSLRELRECEMDPSGKGLWKYLGLEPVVAPAPPVFSESTILLTDDHNKKAVFEMLPGAETESLW